MAMNPQRPPDEDFKDLRAEAEKRARRETVPLERMSEADIASVIRELRVHQIQLEMQNEQLRQTWIELEQSRKQYARLFDSIDEGFCIIEVLLNPSGEAVDYRFVKTNPAFAAHTGLDDAVGRRMRELAPDHEKAWFEIYGQIALTGEPKRFTHQAKHLGERWFDVHAFRTGQPEERKVAVLFTDITARKQAEQALCEARDELKARVAERTAQLRQTVDVLQEEVAEKIGIQKALERRNDILQKIIDNIPAMLCFYDAEGQVALINKELQKVLGYTLEDFQQSNVTELFYPDPVYRKEVWAHMLAAQPGWRDFFVRNKAGRKVASSWANVQLADGSYVGIGLDIRRRRRNENRLKESEERYRTLVELSPDGIGVERDGAILFVNTTACRLLGAGKPKDLIGKPVLDLVHPDHRRRTARHLDFLHHRRKALRVAEAKLIGLDGEALDVELSAMPIAYQQKPATQIVIRDITRRKETETRLRDSAIQLQQQAELLDLAHDAIVVNDLDGRILFWNRGAERTYGWTRDEAVGRIVHELLCTRFPRNPMDISAGLLKEGQWNGELIHTTRSGKTLVVSSRWALQRDNDGDPCAILEIERDVTQQRRAERAMAEARRFAESVLDTVRESLVVLDAQLTVLSANRAFYTTFDVTAEQTEGRAIYEIGSRQWDVPELRALLEDILPRNTSFEDFEVEHDFEHIGHRVMRLNARRVYHDERKTEMILLAIRDVTVRKQQERDIRENHRQLAELTEELLLTEERERRHIASALHDSIGQSLAFSKRELGVLRKDLPEALVEKLDRAKQEIDEAVQRTRSLTFELSPTTLYTFGLEAAIEELAEQFSKQEGFRSHLDMGNGDEPLSEQTRVFLYRATRELLINVAKHAEAKNVRIGVQHVGGNVRIEVEDDGKGFDVAAMESAQGSPRTFGVFSLRQRLTHKNGSLMIRSAPGQGTTVTMQVPLETTDQDDMERTRS